jgi:YVTN family beta-propeller protein
MRRRCLFLAFVPALVFAWPPAPGQSPSANQLRFKSPLGLAVDPDGTRAYVALHTAGTVAVIDLKAGKPLKEIAVGGGPYDVALSGGDLYVTCEQSDTLVRVNLARQTVSGCWPMGQAPRGVAVLPKAGRVFVTCHDDQTLRALDLATGKVQSVALPGWPDRLVLYWDADSPYLLALSNRPGEALVSLIDSTLPPRVLHTDRLANVTNARGLAVKEGNKPYVLLAHQRPRTNVPTTQISQGWVFTNAVNAIAPGVADARPPGSRAKVLDDPARGYADPSDVALLPDQRYAFVSSAGADAVLVLRPDRFIGTEYGPSWTGERHGPVKDDLAGSRRYVLDRLAVGANPRRLALSGDGRTLVVSNYLGDSLTVLDARALKVVRTIALGGPEQDAARRGEILFHSGKMTFQGQFTCASCHPDGGSDGLTWDLTRDGIGNFLNTRPLWGVKDTAPYGWHGTSPTLADRVAGTLRTLHRHEPQGSELDDLVAYLKTLEPRRPLPRAETDRPAIARGKVLFEGKAKCTACHHGDALDDPKPHDVGTRVEGDVSDRFDVPSLRGLGRTAPYLHHGRAATLEEVFTTYNAGRRHGSAHLLSKEELADLLLYLKSL